ncbi:MAG: hypothetical protein EOP48_31490 [Sphingobacteriales bacterium]|nr:MAG: hypothetical protein EOP48_31490 [Sphingobacteriales bacterium]
MIQNLTRLFFTLAIVILHKLNAQAGRRSLSNESDTVIVKWINPLTKSYEVGFLSKAYSYLWVTGTDTLNFSVTVSQRVKDSSIDISIHHRSPLLFSEALKRLHNCMPYIRSDFDLSKLRSFHIETPLYYPDVARQTSREYEDKFGRREVSYANLSKFFLGSSFNKVIDGFLSPLGFKADDYFVEKFQLATHKSYEFQVQKLDPKDYPDFIIDGFGMTIRVKRL